MTGINELRQALNDQAADVSDHAVATRSGEIRERVRVVRRRRRSAVAGSAAAVVAVVAGVALLPDGSQDLERPEVANTIVGVAPPQEFTSLGYTYTLQRGVEGDTDTTVLDLAASGEPRLVSWATEGVDDTVTVTDDVSDERLVYRTADFSEFVIIPGGEPARVEVTSVDGSRVGLAAYAVDLDSPPPGVSKDGITFRDEVADQRLLAAEIGDLGDTDLTLETTSRGPQTGTAVFCAGAPRGAFLQVERGDAQYIGEEVCDGRTPIDVTSGVTSPTRAGRPWTVRIFLTDGEDGPVIDAAGARIGVAAYDVPRVVDTGAFEASSALIEYRGHLYRRVEVLEVPLGRQAEQVRLPETETPMLVFANAKARSGITRFTLRGEMKSQSFGLAASGGGVSGVGLGLFSGPDAMVVVKREGTEANDRAAIVTYERID